MAEATGRPPEREAVLSALVSALSRWYVLLHESDGPEKVLADWTSRSSYASGRLVNVVNGDEMVSGITRGLEADGALRLETETEVDITTCATSLVSGVQRDNQTFYDSKTNHHQHLRIILVTSILTCPWLWSFSRVVTSPSSRRWSIYREKIESAGLSFAPVRPNFPAPKGPGSGIDQRRSWNPKTGARYLTEEIIYRGSRLTVISTCSRL